MGDYFVVELPNGSEVKEPRSDFDRCEAIWERNGRTKGDHRAQCKHCLILIDACKVSADLHNMLLSLEPVPESGEVGFVVVE